MDGKRCPNGTRKNRKTRICEKPVIIQPRCKNGFRRNRKTRECEDKTLKKRPDMRKIKRLSRKKIKSIIENELRTRRENNMSPLRNNAKDELKEMRFPSNTYFKGIQTLEEASQLSTENISMSPASLTRVDTDESPIRVASPASLIRMSPKPTSPVSPIQVVSSPTKVASPTQISSYKNDEKPKRRRISRKKKNKNKRELSPTKVETSVSPTKVATHIKAESPTRVASPIPAVANNGEDEEEYYYSSPKSINDNDNDKNIGLTPPRQKVLSPQFQEYD